jgi:hypothetical protein
VVCVGVDAPPVSVDGVVAVGVGVAVLPPLLGVSGVAVVVVAVVVVDVVDVVAVPDGVVVPPEGGAVRTGVVLGTS